MISKLQTVAGAAAIALAMSASVAHAGYMQPGETMGVSLDSPLPEGVFFADLEDYGKVDNANTRLGVNIPVILWSTPFSFYNTRLEFLAALPFAHLDGGGINQIGAITYALGPILAHDFGGGLTGGISAFVRTPDPSQNIAAISLRRTTEGDFRESLQYKIPDGPFSGITLIENGAVTTGFGQSGIVEGENDFFAGDFTAQKSFGKFTIGFTGFGNIDISRSATNFYGTPVGRNVELGGLIAYDFGSATVEGIVTRGILRNGFTPGVSVAPGEETRGWVRVVVPLYVAPAAPKMVTAKY